MGMIQLIENCKWRLEKPHDGSKDPAPSVVELWHCTRWKSRDELFTILPWTAVHTVPSEQVFIMVSNVIPICLISVWISQLALN